MRAKYKVTTFLIIYEFIVCVILRSPQILAKEINPQLDWNVSVSRVNALFDEFDGGGRRVKISGEFYLKFLNKNGKNFTKRCPYTLYFPKNEKNLEAFHQGKKIKTPLVMIIPPIVGATPYDIRLAKKLAHNGISSLILNYEKNDLDFECSETELINKFKINLSAIIAVIRYIKKKDVFFPAEKMGLFGMSLGGVTSSIISSLEKGINGTILYMAGGNIPEILTYSNQEKIVKFRNHNMKEGEERESFLNRMKLIFDPLSIEPFDLAKKSKGGNIYMFITLRDSKIPSAVQKKLAYYYQENKSVRLETWNMRMGHYLGGIFFELYLNKTVKKFREYLF